MTPFNAAASDGLPRRDVVLDRSSAAASAAIAGPSCPSSGYADTCEPSRDLPLELAMRHACMDHAESVGAVLTMPGLGRFEITVVHRASHVEIGIRCATRSGFAWLSARRSALEQRVSRAVGSAASIELSADFAP